LQIGMKGDQPSTAHLGRMIAKFEHGTDFAASPQNHVPCQFGDFASAKTSLSRQKNDKPVAEGEASMIGEKQEIVDVIGRKYLGLFTRHLASNQLLKSILDQLNLTATETLHQMTV
jgi:hypothetical protein